MSNSAEKNPKIRDVDFIHRLAGSGASQTEDFSVVDSIGLITERALAVLHLLSVQFEDSDVDRISDRLMAGAIDSVIKEIEDINSIMTALIRVGYADTAKNQAQKNPEL